MTDEQKGKKMRIKNKIVSFKLDKDLHAKLKKAAKAEHRSVSSYIRLAVSSSFRAISRKDQKTFSS